MCLGLYAASALYLGTKAIFIPLDAKQPGSINTLIVSNMEPSRPLAGTLEIPIGTETVPVARLGGLQRKLQSTVKQIPCRF